VGFLEVGKSVLAVGKSGSSGREEQLEAAVVTIALVPVLPAGLPILAAVLVGGGAAVLRVKTSGAR